MSTTLPRNQELFASASIQAFVATPQAFAATPISAVAPHIDRTTDTDCLAHDARNWLTVLRVYCDLLRTSGAVASGYEKWMEELSSAVERGHELVGSLLNSVQRTHSADEPAIGTAAGPSVKDSSSTLRCKGTDSAESMVPESSTFLSPSLNMGEAIARRMPLFERLAGNDIHVELDTRAHAGNVSLPESAFERILQNLVRNAIEAMPNGGRLRIALRPTNRKSTRTSNRVSRDTSRSKAQARNTLLLRVSDTGNGIAPERLPYIFEAGFSSKPECRKDHPEHGFGLAIVRELTESAGGAVRVRSHPGRGSCFEIELPTV